MKAPYTGHPGVVQKFSTAMITDQKSRAPINIERMIEVVMEAADGNYQQEELSDKNNIFNTLATGINLMVADIRTGSQKIEKENDLAQNIIASISDLFVVVDKTKNILLINDTGKQLLGYDLSDDLKGKSLKEVIGEDPFEDLAGTSSSLSFRNAEKNLTTKDLRQISVSLSASAVCDKDGKMVGIISIARDITCKKEGENKVRECMQHLEKVNKELEQFAYIISHDLKAPLRAITNLSEWIEEDLGSDVSEDIKKNMATLRGRVRRMEALINGVLIYSKSTRTKGDITTFDLNDLIDQLLPGLSVPAKFSVAKKKNLPTITNNRTWIEQIFTHLLGNAIRHHDKEEGKIEIDVKENGEWLEFSVTDDGPGIQPEFHEKVFAIFQTLEARDKSENTGIGLTIVKKIVEEEGGKIWINSAKGEGTSVLFTIPREYKKNVI